jgi:hypothetical protein
MNAVRVPYVSSRRLKGLGEGAASDTANYANYAKAIYQAISGDVSGAAYNAAITFAGPLAAIGNAIANFANRKKDADSAAVTSLLDALEQAGFLARVSFGRAGLRYLIPGCRMLSADDKAQEVARAIKNNMPVEFVGEKMLAWVSSAVPFQSGAIKAYLSQDKYDKFCGTPAPSSAPIALPTSQPTVIPLPVYVAPLEPAPPAQAMILPATSTAPAITVNMPSSVPPDQTPLLIQQLMAQGANQSQAYAAALQSLAARGVPSSPVVQQRVASDVSRSSAPQIASTSWIVAGVVVLLGVGLFMRIRT